MKTQKTDSSIYEISICYRVRLEAHSLSNIGSKGTNRVFPRRQLLANGVETDAISGNIYKHHHAALLTSYFDWHSVPLCTACRNRNVMRMAASFKPSKADSIDNALIKCGICDAHGFLVTAKNNADENGEKREGSAKHSLIEFSLALADPELCQESSQLYTRSGENKMILTVPGRSAEYAMCIRYTAAGVGIDTERWKPVLNNEPQRKLRHQLILFALRDQLLSPTGAMTSLQLPHLSNLQGSIVCLASAGRAPIFSPLKQGFQDVLEKLGAVLMNNCVVHKFNDVVEFAEIITKLANTTQPAFPHLKQQG